MSNFYDFTEIKSNINSSNLDSAYKNCNLYIIQEQASLMEVFEQYPCHCTEDCTCRSNEFGCTYHWRLKAGLSFEQFCNAYLRMFVKRHDHKKITDYLKEKSSIGNIRSKNAGPFLSKLKENWNQGENWNLRARKNCKSLLCDNWKDDLLIKELSFDHYNNNSPSKVYWVKLWSIIYPDICVPYDTNSLKKIKECLVKKSNNNHFLDVLESLRDKLIALIKTERKNVSDFRKLDAPGETKLQFNQGLISLRNKDFDYGTDYLPVERPLSRVIDKIFYTPSKGNS